MPAVAIVAAYLASRLVFIARFPYFLDEGTYAKFTYEAAHSLHQLFVSMSIGREPLQIWLGIPFVKLGFSGLIAMRLVSMLAGLATVAVVGVLGWRLAGATVGLVAAGMCVVLPFFAVHDGIGIMEPLVTLIVASALLVQLELARRPRLALGVALGIVLGAGALTKENYLPAAALIPASLLCFDWSPAGRGRRMRVWLGSIAIGLAGIAAAQLILRSTHYYPTFVAQRKTGFYTVRTLSAVVADPFASWSTAWSVFRPALVGYVTVPLLLAAAGGAVVALRRWLAPAVVLLAWVLLPLLVSLTFTAFPFPRHVMYLMPPIIVFAAYGLVCVSRWTVLRVAPAALARPAAVAIPLLLLAPALIFDARVLDHPATAHYPGPDEQQYVTGTQAGSAWPALADAIRRFAAGRRVVILHPTADTNVTQFILGWDNPRYQFVPGYSPLARHAQLAVTDEIPFIDPAALYYMNRGRASLVGRFRRANGGPAVNLYELRANQ